MTDISDNHRRLFSGFSGWSGWIFLSPCLLAAGLITATSLAPPVSAADPIISFNRDVRPILADKCFHCHGPDAPTRKAELRLDTAEGVLQRKTAVLVPGNSAESLLIHRINSSDPTEVMPPPESNKTLTLPQKEILKLWIEQGAKYEKHWAFEPIANVAPPVVSACTLAAGRLNRTA